MWGHCDIPGRVFFPGERKTIFWKVTCLLLKNFKHGRKKEFHKTKISIAAPPFIHHYSTLKSVAFPHAKLTPFLKNNTVGNDCLMILFPFLQFLKELHWTLAATWKGTYPSSKLTLISIIQRIESLFWSYSKALKKPQPPNQKIPHKTPSPTLLYKDQ